MSIIGIDSGGTFTDVVIRGSCGTPHLAIKLPSTPADPAEAVMRGAAEARSHLSSEALAHLVYGTTVATNAVLQRRLAPTALVTNCGFKDLLAIGRGNRPDLFAAQPSKPPPLTEPALCFGVSARLSATGEVLATPSATELADLAERIGRSGARSIAICLLHSYRCGAQERQVGKALASLGLPITLSHAIFPEFREVERATTAVVNAGLVPIIGPHLATCAADEPNLYVMQSDGSVAPSGRSAREPVRTLLSGPAGGVLGAGLAADALGIDAFMSLDMGGTSTDLALSGCGLRSTVQVGAVTVALQALDIVTIGAGGGSLAWIDAGGALRVGPRSAGAQPGPACYGVGTEPTLTDAWLVDGRLHAPLFLGGRQELDVERSRAAIGRLGQRLGLPTAQTASGILQVSLAACQRAAGRAASQRGVDPRELTLVAFGGAGGLIAAELARSLRMRGVLIPQSPGVLSAWGLTHAALAVKRSRCVLWPWKADTPAQIDLLAHDLRHGVEAELRDEDASAATTYLVELDARYMGQGHAITLPYTASFASDFHLLHHKFNGFSDPLAPIEVVCVRVTGACAAPPPPARLALAEMLRQPARPAIPTASAAGYAIYWREQLAVGATVAGPATVGEPTATTCVPAGCRLRVLPNGAMWIEHP